VAHINTEIRDALLGRDVTDQRAIDQVLIALDGTAGKTRLGANAMLAVSLACAHASAAGQVSPLYRSLGPGNTLPMPMMNIVNGGAHADNNVDIQEFMILPLAAPRFSEALRWGTEIYQALKSQLKAQGLSTAVGDEGGFAPDLPSNIAALDLIVSAIERAGFKPGSEVALGLDVASSELLQPQGHYKLDGEGRLFDVQQWCDWLAGLTEQFPIVSIEDGMAESDWAGWRLLSQTLGQRIQLVGDDLFVTQTELIERGVRESAANALLVKPNQVGTLSETLDAMNAAREAGWARVVSHRSGETEDTTIADLAVATDAGQIKTGAPCRSDRVAKFNRLLVIEQEIGKDAHYAGAAALAGRPHA
jgi:enolase